MASDASAATLTASVNPILVPYGQTSGSTSFNWNATDFFQAGGYTGIRVVNRSSGAVICSGSSATGTCGSATVTNSQNFNLLAVRYNGTTVQAASTTVSVSDAIPVVNVDTPQTNASYISPVVFGGWAVDHVYAISYVKVVIDGVSKGNAVYGGNRQDVCNSYTQAKSCPNVGYSYSFDPAYIAGGSHTITFTAVDTSGDSTSASKTFTTTQAVTGINIDNPNQTQKPTILGATTLSGWAVDSGDTVTSVSIAIDGTNRGSATYGGSRPDICTNYGNYPGCSTSGWSMAFDTAYLTGGQHTLAVTAYTSDARQTTVTGVLNVQQAITTVDIDAPQSGGSYTGTLPFGGWVVDNTNAISSVSVTIDGTVYSALYGGSRPDVCSSGSSPGCPNVGWNYLFNSSNFAAGSHSMTVTATTSDGRVSSQSVTFNAVPPTTQINIDSPNGQTFSGTQTFGGWAVDNAASIASVVAAVDGTSIGSATYGGSRADVCAQVGNDPGCPNVGWGISVNTAQFSNGTHTLTITATTSDSRTQSRNATFTSVNTTSTTPNPALAPASPKKEYIRANGQVVAVRNNP